VILCARQRKSRVNHVLIFTPILIRNRNSYGASKLLTYQVRSNEKARKGKRKREREIERRTLKTGTRSPRIVSAKRDDGGVDRRMSSAKWQVFYGAASEADSYIL